MVSGDSTGHCNQLSRAMLFCSSGRAIVPRSWEQQAADALPLPARHPYQSQSVAFAVRAAEALAPFNADPLHASDASISTPSAAKTAICCQVTMHTASPDKHAVHLRYRKDLQ